MLTPHEYKCLMDRFEDEKRFQRVELTGTIAAAVVNFAMNHPKEYQSPASFFEAPAKKRINKKKVAERMRQTMQTVTALAELKKKSDGG